MCLCTNIFLRPFDCKVIDRSNTYHGQNQVLVMSFPTKGHQWPESSPWSSSCHWKDLFQEEARWHRGRILMGRWGHACLCRPTALGSPLCLRQCSPAPPASQPQACSSLHLISAVRITSKFCIQMNLQECCYKKYPFPKDSWENSWPVSAIEKEGGDVNVTSLKGSRFSSLLPQPAVAPG